MPVAIRIDGKAFHSFTRGFRIPFDDILIKSMQDTMKYMCENIQGCVLGYHQSDEITLILIDYQSLTSDAWFDYNQSKIESIASSMATMRFNKAFVENVDKFCEEHTISENTSDGFSMRFDTPENEKLYGKYNEAIEKGAMFDSRAFNIPREEVTNLILWRQQDATRNSIEMVGRAYFSHKQLHKVNTNGIQDMLFKEHGVNWNDYPTHQKRGSCCVKEIYIIDGDGNEYSVERGEAEGLKTIRSRWIVDTEIPIFTGLGRNYIEERIIFE